MSNPNYNIWCSSWAQNCVSGCCDLWGDCAIRQINCDFRYDDYFTNSGYYFPDDPAPATIAQVTSLGGIIGGIIAGVIVLAIIIGVIIWCKKRQAVAQMAVHEDTVGSTTVIMGNQPAQYQTQGYQGQPYQQPYSMQPYGQGGYVVQPNQSVPVQYPPQQGPIIIKS